MSVAEKDTRIRSQLLTLVYGQIVSYIVQDSKNVEDVNAQLNQMGVNMGVKLIDEFIAKTNKKFCSSLKEMAETIATLGFDMFLGVKCEIKEYDQQDPNNLNSACKFKLVFQQNPLNEFVKLPENLTELNYSNIICGIITGAMSQLQVEALCKFTGDTLKGQEACEITIEMKKMEIKKKKKKD